MANGYGGRRPGAGRKPKSAYLRALDGGAGKRPAKSEAPPPPPAAAVDEFDAPNDLDMETRHVWLELAPEASKKRTLTKATALAFKILCRNVVLERQYALSVTDRGSANHRGMIQRVDAELLAFDLRPCGKPIYDGEEQVAPANDADAFRKAKARRA